MRIEQLMDKERRAQYLLLMKLYQTDHLLSLKEVLNHFNLSKVTLIKYISNLNQLLAVAGLSSSISLEQDLLELSDDGQFTWPELLDILLEDSIPYHILLYLYRHETFNISSLSQELMISEATLNRHLAYLNTCLEEFNLSIWQGKQIGSEIQWRYFYYDLFSQSLSSDKLSCLISGLDRQNLLNLIEKMVGQELSEDTLQTILLWLAISQNRLSFTGDKSFAGDLDLAFIEENVFFTRLEKTMIHYLRRYAIEFDTFEVKSLFVFLLSYPILPIPSMEYILGFGGPIADKISEALWLLRKADIIGERTKEELIYGLGVFFSRAYFFRGAIISRNNPTQALYQLVEEEKREKVHFIIGHFIMQAGDKTLQETDLAKVLSYDLLELLIFSIERHHRPLEIGLDFGSNRVQQAIVEISIRKHLENNRNFQLESFATERSFDCIIRYKKCPYLGELPCYHLKDYSSPLELKYLEEFLKELHYHKNNQKTVREK
ncbi:helix-turn-helix domain-containing protein [Streptococcus didelphis]|uniref:Helix-turn-helix domain-containing protein n=1 Tax=Streptococcus didelphis TaxID=102886 RepID=A0ABY9LKK5_9STRE|nr:helix-turn-helix domain-containing protein [Streptococcus didelphis]WMB28616.1 helix-turn-helix domain-containing protein [Streptococcus didelphis]WMB29297.1 helix-turn-helix domain-containing protein [Streptococcus didelphis]